MRGVQVKLWDLLRAHAIPERLRGVLTTRRYTNSRLPLPLHANTKKTTDHKLMHLCRSAYISATFNVEQ